MITGVATYLLAPALGWLTAQGSKYIVAVIRTGSFRNLRWFYLSGNMPSAHSATTVSLATIIGLRDGLDSAVFAVATLLALVTMYDAMVLRRSVGEQGKAIQQIIKMQKLTRVPLPRAAKGHTPLEVLVGALLGVGIGTIVFFAT